MSVALTNGQVYEYKRPWLYPKQENAIFDPARIAIIEASTKSGKTVGCIIWLFEQALQAPEPGQNFWWVAPVDKQSDIAWRRMKAAVPKELFDKNENLKRMDLVNGSTITFKTGDNPDNLYGEDVYAAVIDEASRVKEDSWIAVRSTLTATQGPIRIIGNVKGKKNWAWRLARLAQSGKGRDMSYHKITAWDSVEAGVLEQQEIEDAKAILPESVFKELYLAEAADDSGNPFGWEHIQACILLDPVTGLPTTKPMNTKPVAWGWDVAKYDNYTVGIALDKDGNVCRFERFQSDWEATLHRVTTLTQKCNAYIDSTGSGDQVLERIRKAGGTNFQGIKFSTQSKQNLMLGLAVVIQNREIGYPAGPIVDELEMFEYDVRPTGNVIYAAAEGHYDDCVDALALAVMLWKRNRTMPSDMEMVTLPQVSYWRTNWR